MSAMKEFTKGLWKENPVLVLLLGMCPTLAVTSSATNGLGMGVATMFVLLGSNVVVSSIRKIVPKKIRIPVYIAIIATFVTIVDLLMQAYAPTALYEALGIFIPLIVVNCIVLGRAEAFASKNGVGKSVFDALGMGLGFTLALVALVGTGRLYHSRAFPGGNECPEHAQGKESGYHLQASKPGLQHLQHLRYRRREVDPDSCVEM